MQKLRLGSLFDGIGGFPLAAAVCGMEPVCASEIETFPIEVTRLRFPGMLHVGDITKLRGAELPPVDIVCGGSPCQDLSIAGLRAGLAGARSGLFMEQLRVIREMRDADRARGRTALAVRPRYMLWEIVPQIQMIKIISLVDECLVADYLAVVVYEYIAHDGIHPSFEICIRGIFIFII